MDDQRRLLLLLAEQVARLDADLGNLSAQAWFTAAIDSLAHALVDLSDGRSEATRASATPGTASTEHADPARDRASCAAARAELAAVRWALTDIRLRHDGARCELGEHTESSLDLLIAALGEAAAPTAHEVSGPPPSAHRNLRAAFRLLQPPAARLLNS
ncbi:MAG: hypothetical protein WBB15_15715 [Ornithinimicrobium sp.]